MRQDYTIYMLPPRVWLSTDSCLSLYWYQTSGSLWYNQFPYSLSIVLNAFIPIEKYLYSGYYIYNLQISLMEVSKIKKHSLRFFQSTIFNLERYFTHIVWGLVHREPFIKIFDLVHPWMCSLLLFVDPQTIAGPSYSEVGDEREMKSPWDFGGLVDLSCFFGV